MTEKRKYSILMAAITALIAAVMLFLFYNIPDEFKKFWKDLGDSILGKLKRKDRVDA